MRWLWQIATVHCYQHNIPKKPDVDPKCRLCGRFDGTIDHLVSSCPSSRNPLCLPKSMVWTRMLREKINRNYTSISYVSGYDRAGNISENHWWCSAPISTSTWDQKKTLLHPKRSREIQKRIWGTNLDRATDERVTKFARRVKQKVKPHAQETHWSEAVGRKRTTRKIPQKNKKSRC